MRVVNRPTRPEALEELPATRRAAPARRPWFPPLRCIGLRPPIRPGTRGDPARRFCCTLQPLMPDPPRKLSARAAMDAYVERLDELLRSCAEHQRHDPEVFLWNARRALEAMCHILLTAHAELNKGKKPELDERSLDQMIKELVRAGVLDDQPETRFDAVRKHTNLGVHIRQPSREDYPAAVADVAHILPGLVDWLFGESLAAPFLTRPATLATQAIRSGGYENLPPREAVRQAEVEKASALGRAVAAEAERDAARRAVAAGQALKWRRFRWFVATSAVVGTFGFATGIAAQVVVGSALRSNLLASAAAPVTAAVPEPEAEGAGAEAALGAAPSAATPGTCPVGTLLVPATEGLRLGQPVGGRQNWPKPLRRVLPRASVPAFCIDPTPVRREDFGAWEAAPSPAAACRWDTPARDASPWTNCLTRAEAEAFCAQAHPGGQLPSLLEWESATRASPVGLVLPEHEWTRERFPTAALGLVDRSWSRGDAMWVGRLRRPPESAVGNVLLSWNQQDPDLRHPERTFRCAAPLSQVDPP